VLLAAVLGAPLAAAHAACFVAASGLSFGSYDVFDSLPRDSIATISLSCTEPVARSVRVTLGPSAGSGLIAQRSMTVASSSDKLAYNLFTDSGRGQVWGDGATGGAAVVVDGVSKNQPRQVFVYARVPAGQDVRVGNYLDSLTVTVDIVR